MSSLIILSVTAIFLMAGFGADGNEISYNLRCAPAVQCYVDQQLVADLNFRGFYLDMMVHYELGSNLCPGDSVLITCRQPRESAPWIEEPVLDKSFHVGCSEIGKFEIKLPYENEFHSIPGGLGLHDWIVDEKSTIPQCLQEDE